jgi:hypothetical protein
MSLAALFERPVARPSLCALEALRGTSGGETMTTPGGVRTPPRYRYNSNRARRTGFYHGSELLRWLRYGTPALRLGPARGARPECVDHRREWSRHTTAPIAPPGPLITRSGSYQITSHSPCTNHSFAAHWRVDEDVTERYNLVEPGTPVLPPPRRPGFCLGCVSVPYGGVSYVQISWCT